MHGSHNIVLEIRHGKKLLKHKGLTTHSWASQEIIYLTQKHKSTIKFEEIQTKSSSFGAPKIANNDNHHLIGQ